MKTLVTLVVMIVMAVCGTAAIADDFVCNVSKVGDQFTYTLQNNHATYDVVEWYLCWNADNTLNTPIAAANFDRADTSYKNLPTLWFRSDDVTEPRFATDDAPSGSPLQHNSGVAGQKSFTIVYKSTSSTPAPLFKVGCTNSAQGNAWVGWTDAMNVVPEPTSIMALLSGLAGSGLFLRRKRS